MCISNREFWEPHFEKHCFRGHPTISWLLGNVPVHLNQPKFTFSLHEVRILQKLWTIFPKLRLLKMTLLGLLPRPWHVCPTYQFIECFQMLGWDVLTFVFHLTFLNITYWSRWEGWFRCHHSEHWQMYPSLCPMCFSIGSSWGCYFAVIAGGALYLQELRSGQYCKPHF